MRVTAVALCLLMCVTIVPVQAQDVDSPIETVDCWMELPEGVDEGTNLDCGYLTVPEDRTAADSPTIQIAFVTLYASVDEAQPDPIVYLAGGPGGNAVGELEDWIANPYAQDRDVILLDQRGTGYSQPSLNCPEAEEELEDATQLCHDRLIAGGVNLQAYNSAENAADVADLMRALGYSAWNLYGVSYGTRLALTIMRDHPDGVRSVILDSVYPPEVRSWEEYGRNTADVFNRLFQACAANADCNAAYPELGQTFSSIVEQLTAQPVEYEGTDAESGENVLKTMTGGDFIERLFQLLYSTESIQFLPYVIGEVADGNYAALDELESGTLLESGRRQPPESDDVSDSEGMNLSVECQEEVAFLNEETALANVPAEPAALYDNSIRSIQETFRDCQIWNVAAADEIETRPVTSDIPTLVVAGEFDPITPAAWAESAVRYLPNSFYFLFPGGGHGVIDMNDCSQGIMQAFLNDPMAEPDGSCIEDIGEPEWALPTN